MREAALPSSADQRCSCRGRWPPRKGGITATYICYIGIMEKKIETTGIIGYILGLYYGYRGIIVIGYLIVTKVLAALAAIWRA